MAREHICVICGKPITDPAFQEARRYSINAVKGKTIPQRCCSDACWAEHARIKTGLTGPVTQIPGMLAPLLLVALAVGLMVGCASRGPWPCASEADLEKYLLKEGMTVGECKAKKGNPLREAYYNPRARESYVELPPDFTGIVYYQIEGSSSNEETRFMAGRVVAIKYVRAPWAGYDTWQRRELSWDKR
jgi:hypothetical protein